MNDFTLFLGKFFKHGTAIASVAPSSRWLSRLTVGNVDWERAGTLVELGGGTGPITRAIAERQRTNFEIVRADAGDLASILLDRGITAVDHVISGLPVPSFGKSLQESLFRAVGTFLCPLGTFNQITEIPWLYRRLYQRHFQDVRFVLEPRNLPPAGTYFCRRPRAVA